jgi:hypothetical protein
MEFVKEGLDFGEEEEEESYSNRIYPKDLGYKAEHDTSALIVRNQAQLRDCLMLWRDAGSELHAMQDIFCIYPKARFATKLSLQVALAEAGFCSEKVSDDIESLL